MTKNGKTGPKTKRQKVKYPALNKGMNLNSRKDYIEPEYINGVFGEDGKQVIRALTPEEKEWLNKYYEETVVTNFYHDPDLKKLNRHKKSIIVDDTVRTMQDQVKELQKDKETNKKRIRELKEIIRLTKKQNEETYSEALEDVEEALQELREQVLLYPDKEDHKEFYNHNNARNNCIFNKTRIMGKLTDLNIEEYDAYVANTIKDLDTEFLPDENEEINFDKVEEILEEVKAHFVKKQKS
jgi:hypothetical protein